MNHTARVTSAVLFVSELEPSAAFYSELFGFTNSIESEGGRLLQAPDGFQLYLIAKGPDAEHPSEQIGVQYLMWSVDSPDDLAAVERSLKSQDRYTYTHSDGGVTFVEGTDPDRMRIVIAHPSPLQQPRSVLDSRIYS